ncbi:MAG: malonate decarboxylase holo-[acyl-carrier-protein] synthase [Terrimicrobiaceae bacterium]
MIRRHSLVWLHSPPLATTSLSLVETWFEAGNPFMVCRTRENEDLSLGFCLPRPPGDMRSPGRYAAHGKPKDIQTLSRPPAVHEIAEAKVVGLPKDALQKSPWTDWPQAPEGCTIRIIGSRMWETLTGVCYTTPSSDIDLVCDLADARSIDPAATFLSELQAMSPFNIDAEISVPGRGEIHWKEWHSQAEAVLVKSREFVALKPREWVLETRAP